MTASTVRRHRNAVFIGKALDGIVAANTFLVVAVVIGITQTITPLKYISPNCVAGDDIAGWFFIFQIFSVGFYLLSSLIAQGGKLAVALLASDSFSSGQSAPGTPFFHAFRNTYSSDGQSSIGQFWPYHSIDSYSVDSEMIPEPLAEKCKELRIHVLKHVQPMMLWAAVSTIIGTFFLLASMVEAIQLKFGIISCGIPNATIPSLILSLIVAGGVCIYGYSVIYSFKNYER